jgi:hypothetical protein
VCFGLFFKNNAGGAWDNVEIFEAGVKGSLGNDIKVLKLIKQP